MGLAVLPAGKRVLFAGASVVIGLAIGGLLLEGGLRLLDARRRKAPPAQDTLALVRPNPNGTGSYRLKPNLDLTTRVGNRSVRIRTNSDGMAWREVLSQAERRGQRVAFLGDSFTFGCWADDYDHAFVGVFQRTVPRVEALNFGVGGYGFLDEELQLHEEVLRFSPTHVVIVSYNGNDFRDSFLGLSRERIVNGAAELDPRVVQAKVPAELLVEDSTRPRDCAPRSWLEARAQRLSSYWHLASLLDLGRPCVEFAVNRNFTMPTFWSQYPYSQGALRAKDESLAVLGRIDETLRERGIKFGIVMLPTADQVYSRSIIGPGYDIQLPQAYVSAFARERGLPSLDLLLPLREHALTAGGRLYENNDIHLNNRGHELVGKLIAQWFRCCLR